MANWWRGSETCACKEWTEIFSINEIFGTNSSNSDTPYQQNFGLNENIDTRHTKRDASEHYIQYGDYAAHTWKSKQILHMIMTWNIICCVRERELFFFIFHILYTALDRIWVILHIIHLCSERFPPPLLRSQWSRECTCQWRRGGKN